jgi:hypothetical protein
MKPQKKVTNVQAFEYAFSIIPLPVVTISKKMEKYANQ